MADPDRAVGGRTAADPRKARLIRIIEERSLWRQADFELVSGAASTFYFDMKPTAFDPEGASLIAELILEALAADRVDLIGGLEMGAVPIIACVCQLSHRARPIAGFFVRKEAKDHGTKRLIEGVPRDQELAGKHAVLVEDVTTTGGSVLAAVGAARDAGCRVSKVVTVVDRLQGAGDNLGRHGIELVALLSAEDFDL
ncbi:MAG: orotate phosphoribosyltransferase [Alphaproteobacteria bacterium]